MVILHPSSRPMSAPWPHDGTIGGFGVRMGVTDQRGTRLLGEVPADMGNVAPVEFGEQAKNPVFGGVVSIRDLSRGFGQRRQRGDGNGRYWYGLNLRARPGYALAGPALTEYTPATLDATVGVTRFFKINSTWFALCGRYCLTGGSDGTGWTVSKDFGSGKAAVDVIVIQTNQAASVRYALVAMGDSENVWYFDGTTWTQTSAGNAFTSRAWAVDTTTLYWVTDSNRLYSCDLDADVLVVANHASATDRVGGKDQPVTRMKVNGAGSLAVCKQDDIHFLQPDGSWRRAFEERAFVPAATNGEALSRWLNDTYVTYGNATFRLTDDGGLTQVGPETLQDNGSPVRGYLTAHCGSDFCLLAGMYNPDTATSYVMEFTGEITEGPYGRPEPVWHGSITPAFASKRITCIEVDTAGAPAGHKMAYIGFSDGTIAKYVLACTPDPADCTSEVFSTATSELYYSRLLFHFPGQRKALLAATGEADNWGASNYATFSYRTSPSAGYSSIGAAFDSGERHRLVFPDSLGCTFLDAKLALTAATSVSSPRVTGVSLDWQLRTLPQEVMVVNVLAEDGLRMRDGTPYRVGAAEIRARMASLAALVGGVTFIDPNGESHAVTVLTPQRATAYDLPTRMPHDAIRVMLIERRETEAHGGLNEAALLTLNQMTAYTLAGLTDLSS